MKERKIKYAIELFEDYPNTYTDQDVDEDIKRTMWNFFIPSVIWCRNDEKLFDNPYKCKTFIETPIEKGYIRIKYALEDTIFVPHNFSAEDIVNKIRYLAERQNGCSFIWCYENKELFRR